MTVIFRLVLVIAVIATGAYLLGFWTPGDVMGGRWRSTTGTVKPVDPVALRDGLEKVDERAGRAVQTAAAYMSDAGLSGKIKSKMALDDLVRARTIDVSTAGGIVTVAGTVGSIAERDQAIKLARDTTGVTQVVDHLIVSR